MQRNELQYILCTVYKSNSKWIADGNAQAENYNISIQFSSKVQEKISVSLG